jgi:hypothetical protein
MKIKTISVTYERKINLGDYNSATIGLSLWAEVEDDEDHAEAVVELQRQAREFAKAEYKRLMRPGVPANGTVKD